MGLLGLAIGFSIGYFLGTRDTQDKRGSEKHQYIKLDDVMLVISGIVTFISIVLIAFGKLEKVAAIAINTFGTMVFSWILTKKSAKHEFKEHEQELALRSYRHINYIDTAANTAYKEIENFLDDIKDTETKLMLSKAMDHIKYIQGGISTCKLDWHDMLSDFHKKEYRKTIKNLDDTIEYGVIRIDVQNEQINQEEA